MSRPLPRWLDALVDVPSPRAPKSPPAHLIEPDRQRIPVLLQGIPAWAVWRYEQDAKGRWSKPPYQPDGERADGASSSTFSPFDRAWDAYRDSRNRWAGVSFALDPRFGILAFDLDHTDAHQRDAATIIRTLDSYTELSPSGAGAHVWVRAGLPEGRRRRDWVEIYSRRRFLTVTGVPVPGTPIAPLARRQPETLHIWREFVQQDG